MCTICVGSGMTEGDLSLFHQKRFIYFFGYLTIHLNSRKTPQTNAAEAVLCYCTLFLRYFYPRHYRTYSVPKKYFFFAVSNLKIATQLFWSTS